MRLAPFAVVAALSTAILPAQEPGSSYVPLHHWTMPYLEHLIAAGMMPDPDPMTRPLRRADAVRALQSIDTLRARGPVRATVRRLLVELEDRELGPYGRAELSLGGSAATHGSRDPLREAGDDHAALMAGAALTGRFGPLVLGTHPYFDNRLKYDPDYLGKKDRAIAGRAREAYAAVQTRYADLFFGLLDRNWGMPQVEGLLVSPSPYSYDHVALRLGTNGVRLDAVVAELDPLPDTLGAEAQRYYVAHRLRLRPPGAVTFALWEGTLVAGEGRGLDQWFANVLNLGLLAGYDQDSRANHQLGLDLRIAPGGWPVLYGSIMLDDIQIDTGNRGDDEPSAYGLTLGAVGRAPWAGRWSAYYTRVSNLAFRTPNPTETVMRRNVGLARNFADYEQATVEGEWLMLPGLLVRPQATLLRQGEGDFRLPYPAVADYAVTPTIFAGVVERTLRAAVSGDALLPLGFATRIDAAVHFVRDAGHVSGASETRFVGRVELVYRFVAASRLP